MPKLILHLEEPESRGDILRRSCVLERNGSNSSQERLLFDLPTGLPGIADDDGEPFLIAMVMAAMAERRDIRVEGRVSATLLANLEEYCAAWNCWLPEEYARISMDAQRIEDYAHPTPAAASSAVTAFSGGADSTFTVWSHVSRRAGHRSLNISHCAMVRGFDIPFGSVAEFSVVFEKASAALASVGIPLVPIATNFREISRLNWEHVFLAALVASLHFLKPVGFKALIASGEPYNHLLYPWGSTPMTDYLLSSDSLQVVHDGASFSRTEKVADIASWREGCESLRVCWEGAAKDRNCGVCEKCIRTQLNFLANGLTIPAVLGEPVSNRMIRGVRIRNSTVRTEYAQIYNAAVRNNIRGSWLWALKYLLFAGPIRASIRRCAARILRPFLSYKRMKA